jgi:hypothetical protein
LPNKLRRRPVQPRRKVKKMTKTRLVTAAVMGAWLTGAGTASATLAIQKKAKEGSYGVTNCQSCHNEKLPKKGAVTHNERGQYLVDQKEKRKAKEVDVAWLKEYVAKEAKK